MIKLLDHGYVNLVETWGSDERIIEAARMSTNKGFQGWGPSPCDKCDGFGRIAAQRFVDIEYTDLTLNMDCNACKGIGTVAGDEKLLAYLYRNKHTSVFEQAGATIEIQAPIFVAREVFRHRTFSYNELSARYTELPNLYYIPSIERLMAGKQAASNKQSSQSGFDKELAYKFQREIELSTAQSRGAYELLLANGVAREIARLVIPMNQYTRWRMSGNLRNWLGFLALRLGEGVQPETRDFAVVIAGMLRGVFSRTMELFDESSA